MYFKDKEGRLKLRTVDTKRKLIEQKIFVPMLWPNVPEQQPEDSEACRLAEQILPLPCDQRYGAEEMDFIIRAVRDCLNP